MKHKKIEDAREETSKFRRWIQKTTVRQECKPSLEWVGKYESIINSVQVLVDSSLDLEQKLNIKHGSQQKPRDIMLIRASDAEANRVEKRRQLERAVFQFLYGEILLKPGFGLDDEDEGGKMEAGLTAFEKKIQDASAGNDHVEPNLKLALANDFAADILNKFDYLNWRNLTYRCGKLIRKRAAETNIVAFASALEDFLRPLPKASGGLDNKRIMNICRDTFMLSQGMRAGPDIDFKIYFPEPGDRVAVHKVITHNKEDKAVEIWGERGGNSADVAGTVIYTWIGGLMMEESKNQGVWLPLKSAKVVAKGQEENW
ncbi:hypothetical protein BPAE_0069g00090 [Botrytis paeoniae]|uniref:Uncharacterized protein n=1 Tax=Botrytis paeoniae TaxID=278948 RepID=A0A4Z1FW10_9HELO|nr:hypothetical protein BPAE_0069g00090 [Botrytis paeoniae]